MKVIIDKNQWSEESKKSYAYDSSCAYYEDIKYPCYACGVSVVFAAEEQKVTYEVKKRYIWQRRTLCPQCYRQLQQLKSQIELYEQKWSGESEANKPHVAYIAEWLACIQMLPKYGKRKNQAVERQLLKYIEGHA